MGDEVISKFARQAYRTILAAYKDYTEEEWEAFVEMHPVNDDNEEKKIRAREATEEGLVISAIFGIEDPLRDNIPQTIAKLKGAGVRTRMCTGDNVETAKSICEKAGIIVKLDDDPDARITAHERADPLFKQLREQYQCMTGEEFRKKFGTYDEEKEIWKARNNKFAW